MNSKKTPAIIWLDALGLFLAGLINTFLALFVAGVVLGPGTDAMQPDLLLRTKWIAEHTLRWQGGWLFWFAVTLSFAWSYFALGRHLHNAHPWKFLAVGLALIAAAVDIVGVLVNITVLPVLAEGVVGGAEQAMVLQLMFRAMENFAYALVNVAAFGLYSVAGLLLIPAAVTTTSYPRQLIWLGGAEWGIAAVATVLLITAPALATIPLLVSFALYAPWVWGSALWILRGKK